MMSPSAPPPSTPPLCRPGKTTDSDEEERISTPKMSNKIKNKGYLPPPLNLASSSSASGVCGTSCSSMKYLKAKAYYCMPWLGQVEKYYLSLPCYSQALILCASIAVKFCITFYILTKVLGIPFHHDFFFGMGKTKAVANVSYVSVEGPDFRVNHDREILSSDKKGIEEEKGRRAMAMVADDDDDESDAFRILHIVTTLAEYNSGTRGTKRGEDRLKELLIPVLQYNVESLLTRKGWEVDVYLVLGFELKPERRKLIEDALPEGVGLEIWDNATPYSYDVRNGKKDDHLTEITRALARQHRYVLKDKIIHYDFFSVWEDDMLVTEDHVSNFLDMSRTLEKLADEAPETSDNSQSIRGQLTKRQIKRMIPGFIRVEVLIDHEQEGVTETGIDPDQNVSLDPEFCCTVPDNFDFLTDPPKNPDPDRLMMWESGIKAYGIRELPRLGWVVLLTGPSRLNQKEEITSYWTGQDGAFQDEKRPEGSNPRLFGQQGGYMVTKKQIGYLQNVACKGGFFPPYNLPFVNDGLHMVNVEFWSGGFQHFGRSSTFAQGCNMQRVISMDSAKFSKQLLYHTANNKQKTIRQAWRLVNANHVFQQLHTVLKNAIEKNPIKLF